MRDGKEPKELSESKGASSWVCAFLAYKSSRPVGHLKCVRYMQESRAPCAEAGDCDLTARGAVSEGGLWCFLVPYRNQLRMLS